MNMVKMMGSVGADISNALAASCGACTLIEAPSPEASAVMTNANLPDPFLPKSASYWFINAIGAWRAMNRGF